MSRATSEGGVDERRGDPAVSPAAVVMVAAAFVVVLAVLLWLLWRVLGVYAPWARDVPRETPPSQHSAAAHWAEQRADLERLRESEQTELDALGWVDRRAGIARIPIADAMALYAREIDHIGSNVRPDSASPPSSREHPNPQEPRSQP